LVIGHVRFAILIVVFGISFFGESSCRANFKTLVKPNDNSQMVDSTVKCNFELNG